MAVQPCFIPGGLSDFAYTRQVPVIGISYQEILRLRVECPECRVGLATGYLIMHPQGQHCIGWVDQVQLHPPPPIPPPYEAYTYLFSFPAAITRLRCPLVECQGGGATN